MRHITDLVKNILCCATHARVDLKYLEVELVGSSSNAQGLGSTVWLTMPDGRRAHALGMGGGTNSSGERALILGTGQAEEVDLEVLFPSGATVLLEDVETNQRIVVEEP